jgi:UDP-N-acetylmuramoyl-tripeptide--D-alanyl-D-alanine ligase
MMEGTLSQAAQIIQGNLRGPDGKFSGISTDTRTIRAGELFFALQGPNFDGNRFVGVAAEKRAAAAVINAQTDPAFVQIVVDDSRLALGRLAADWRKKMPVTVVGITGSNGKTTLKDLVTSCLSQFASTLATQGNLNNDIGVPTMLSRISPSHRFAVIEMGANHAGEIAYLADITCADVVAITNAGPAHLEGFGSIDGVAKAKGEILDNPRRPAIAVLNADDNYFDYWHSRVTDTEVVTFGLGANAMVRASAIEPRDCGSHFVLHLKGEEIPIALQLAGRHNVINACAAAAIAGGLGLTGAMIRQGLESVRPVSGRLQPVTTPAGYVIYNDSYNANPRSVMAAAEFLAEQGGDTCLVLGDMGELGPASQELHAAVGKAAKEFGVKRLLATGAQSRNTVAAFGDGGQWFDSVDELTDELRKVLTAESRVLIKGSRSARMERVVDALHPTAESAGAH